MNAGGPITDRLTQPVRLRRASARRLPFTGGGPAGNEQLTAMAGVILLILLAVLGVTIVRIGQLISVHLFLGLLLIGPVAAKMASTGYRFARYYTHDSAYRRKGPPELLMRLIAPVVLTTTLIVFVSGVVLLFDGPSHRGQWVLIHKVSFIVWLVFTALHVLGHLQALPASLSAARESTDLTGIASGAAGRYITLIGALVGGLVLALVLLPQFAQWTSHGAFVHHHH